MFFEISIIPDIFLNIHANIEGGYSQDLFGGKTSNEHTYVPNIYFNYSVLNF